VPRGLRIGHSANVEPPGVRTDQSSPSIRRRSSPSSTSPTSTGSGEIRDRSRAHAHAVSQHAAVLGQRGRARKARPHRRSVLIELAHFALIDGHLTADAASQMVVDDGAGLPVTEPPSIDRDAASAAAAPSAARGQWPPQPHDAPHNPRRGVGALARASSAPAIWGPALLAVEVRSLGGRRAEAHRATGALP
jgi:hypothetical protein